MAKTISLVICLLIAVASSAQFQPHHISTLEEVKVKKRMCLESDTLITNMCQSLNSFDVIIYQLFSDTTNHLIRVVGRTCYSTDFIGWPNVSIIQGNFVFGRLREDSTLATTSKGANSEKDGFFDITVDYSRYGALLFYHPGFSIRLFEIGKLADALKKKK